jgi:hypothetical protein
MLVTHRTLLRRRVNSRVVFQRSHFRTQNHQQKTKDPRLSELDDVIDDEFAVLRERYQAPQNPIILAHGLLGFDELHVTGLPGIKYWYGISEALASKGVEVITADVPPAGRIEERAKELADVIERKAGGKSVNIIA